MRSKSQAATAVAISGLLAAGLLTGCSAGGSGDTQTLHVADIYDLQWGIPLKAAAEAYEKANPGTDIVIDAVPFDGYQAAMQTQLVSGSAADVLLLEPPAITDFSARGFLSPITEDLAGDALAGGTWSDSFSGDSVVSLRQADGSDYAVPWSRIHIKMFYNTEQFEAAGAELPSDTWTWDESIAAAKELKAAGNLPWFVGFGGNDANLWWRTVQMLDAMYRPLTDEINLKHADGWSYDPGNPDTVVGETYTADEKYIAFVNGLTDPAKSPEYRAAIETMLEMKPYIQDDLNSWTDGDVAADKFITGGVATHYGTGATAASLLNLADQAGVDLFDVGQAEFPTITEDNFKGLTDGPVNPVAAVRNGFAINAATDKRDLAVSFLKFITDPEQVSSIYASAFDDDGKFTIGEPSAVTGVTYPAESGLVDENITIVPQLSLFGFGGPPTYDQQDTDQYFSQWLELWSGTISVDDFLQQRSASNLAALERNLKVYADEIDQTLIDQNT